LWANVRSRKEVILMKAIKIKVLKIKTGLKAGKVIGFDDDSG